MVQGRPERHLAGKSGLRRHGVFALRRVSEGSRCGMSYNHMAELLSWNPAQRFGLLSKGDIAPGYDADIVLVDPNSKFVVRAADSEVPPRLYSFRRSGAHGPREKHLSQGWTDLF